MHIHTLLVLCGKPTSALQIDAPLRRMGVLNKSTFLVVKDLGELQLVVNSRLAKNQ